MKLPYAANRRHLPNSPFNAPVVTKPVETYVLQDRVTHDRYGLGTIIGVEEGTAVLVDFGSHQLRITTPYALLSKL